MKDKIIYSIFLFLRELKPKRLVKKTRIRIIPARYVPTLNRGRAHILP